MKVKVYDDGGKTFDQITIVFIDTMIGITEDGNEVYPMLGASLHGRGFFQHCEGVDGDHLGKRIKFEDLSPYLREKVNELYKLIEDEVY